MANNKFDEFMKEEARKIERSTFAGKIISIAIGYTGITLWLNAIRASASLWFVWVLIIIQLLLYFSIFSTSWGRSKDCGLNTTLGLIIFVIMAVLGRINDWELVVIPLTIITMLVVSGFSKSQKIVSE